MILLLFFIFCVALCCFLDRADPPVRYPVIEGLPNQRQARRRMRANRRALRRSLGRLR